MEVNAVFAADLDKLNQNWISEDLVQRLQLTRTFNSGDEAEYGRLEKTFQFRGSLTLRWAEKGGHKSTFTSCRIAPSKNFDLLLQSSLLPLPVLEKCVFDVDLTPAPPLSSPSLEETHLSTASTSTISSVGSFHTEPKVIEENSETYDTFPHLCHLETNRSRAISADNWISAFKRSVHKSIDKEEGYSSIALPVKIAVLDTGLDVKHPGIMTAMQMGQIQRVMRSFVENDKSLQDDCGHGTHIASLISDIAPQAQIYIAKVAGKQEISPNHNIAGVSQSLVPNLTDVAILIGSGFRRYSGLLTSSKSILSRCLLDLKSTIKMCKMQYSGHVQRTSSCSLQRQTKVATPESNILPIETKSSVYTRPTVWEILLISIPRKWTVRAITSQFWVRE